MDQLNPIFVYLDNSNIFLSTQYYSSKKHNYKEGILDVQCRMNTSKLLDLALAGRHPTLKKAYGHMNKEVKHELDKIGFTVFLSDSFHGEKEVDTQLCVDATEDIIRHHYRTAGNNKGGHNGTLILLSGDKDMRPLVKLCRKYEWDVEVWAYQDSLAGALQIEMERKEYGSNMEVKELEKYFSDFAFFDDKNPEIQNERTLLVRFQDRGARIQGMDEVTKDAICSIIKDVGKTRFQLPIATRITTTGKEVGVAVVFVLEEWKGKRRLYSFKHDVMDKMVQFEEDVKGTMRSKFGIHQLYVASIGDSGSDGKKGNFEGNGMHGGGRSMPTASPPKTATGGRTIGHHPAYRTQFCTTARCNPMFCTKAHSLMEIRCYHCSGNHESIQCATTKKNKK